MQFETPRERTYSKQVEYMPALLALGNVAPKTRLRVLLLSASLAVGGGF